MNTASQPAAETALSPAGTEQEYPFQFTGSGNEYFRIWIVNLALSLITFGLYSPWAKVKREKYFHHATRLDNSCFDYHGKPLAILKGRLLAWGLLLLLSACNQLLPKFYIFALIACSPLLPWLLLRAFVFRARNTSWRGLRFDFHGSYRDAVRVFLGWGGLTVVTFGLALPAFLRAIKRFQLDNLSYGGFRLHTDPPLGATYSIFGHAVLITLAPVVVGAALVAAIGGTEWGREQTPLYISALALATYGSAVFLARPYINARLANLVWNHTRFAAHRVVSRQRLWTLAPIVLLNTLLVLATFGFYRPWAQIRLARYRAAHTALVISGSLNDLHGQALSEAAAIGEELGDAFDFDLAL